MKILITGSNGQLGQEIIGVIKKGKSEIENVSERIKQSEIIELNSKELDITDINNIRLILLKEKPDVVINCAAYTDVDGCEYNEKIAFNVNALGARNLAIVSEEVNAKLIHISTDYVFSGDSLFPYKEYDLVNPLTVYGKTKLAGEEYVKQFCSRYFIVRTSWLYGENGNNFVNKIIKLASSNKEIKVVNDQLGNPTNANDLACHILKLIESDEFGLYHCTGKGECTWYEFALEIVGLLNIDCKVNPCKSEEFKSIAKRPKNSSLDNLMLSCTIGDNMRNWKVALKSFTDNIINK